jgi:hypothetical protein
MKNKIMKSTPIARRGRLLDLAPQQTNMTARRSQIPNEYSNVSMGGKEPGSFRSVIDFLQENGQIAV